MTSAVRELLSLAGWPGVPTVPLQALAVLWLTVVTHFLLLQVSL